MPLSINKAFAGRNLTQPDRVPLFTGPVREDEGIAPGFEKKFDDDAEAFVFWLLPLDLPGGYIDQQKREYQRQLAGALRAQGLDKDAAKLKAAIDDNSLFSELGGQAILESAVERLLGDQQHLEKDLARAARTFFGAPYWSGIQEEDGAEVSYSEEAAREILSVPVGPEGSGLTLFDLLLQNRQDALREARARREVERGNSQPSSDTDTESDDADLN